MFGFGVLIGWLGGTAAVAVYAKNRGWSPIIWGIISLFLSPFIAWLLLKSQGSNIQEISIRLFKGGDHIEYLDVNVEDIKNDEISIDTKGTNGPQLFKHLDTIPSGEDPEKYFYFVEKGHDEYGSPARIN